MPGVLPDLLDGITAPEIDPAADLALVWDESAGKLKSVPHGEQFDRLNVAGYIQGDGLAQVVPYTLSEDFGGKFFGGSLYASDALSVAQAAYTTSGPTGAVGVGVTSQGDSLAHVELGYAGFVGGTQVRADSGGSTVVSVGSAAAVLGVYTYEGYGADATVTIDADDGGVVSGIYFYYAPFNVNIDAANGATVSGIYVYPYEDTGTSVTLDARYGSGISDLYMYYLYDGSSVSLGANYGSRISDIYFYGLYDVSNVTIDADYGSVLHGMYTYYCEGPVNFDIAYGGVVQGVYSAYGEGTQSINAQGGSVISGLYIYASDLGDVATATASGNGSALIGTYAYASGGDVTISANNDASVAVGTYVWASGGGDALVDLIGNGSAVIAAYVYSPVAPASARATGNGSLVGGHIVDTDALASANGAFQWGPGTNDLAQSLRVGVGPWFKGTDGAPASPVNGQIWLESGVLMARSGGVTGAVQLA